MTPSNLRAGLLASIAGLALCATSVALARPHYNDNGPVGFTPDSGGYCDYAGCPDHFWRYPVHYGPVFYAGRWYKGPVYYRGDWRDKQYWVRGGWHRDEWRGPRPDWARNAHDGQALPFAYYADHGFRLGDRWRRMHDDERYWDHGGDWHGGPPPGGPGGPPPDWNRDHGNQGGGDWNRNGGGDRDDRDGPPDNGRGGQGRGDDRADNNHGGPDNRGGPPQQDNVIRVTSATYGGQTCHTAAGNVTHFVASTCDGKKTCDYVVQYQTIGDPAPGCAKDFAVQWTCSLGAGGSTSAAAEAGLGSHVALTCGNQGH